MPAKTATRRPVGGLGSEADALLRPVGRILLVSVNGEAGEEPLLRRYRRATRVAGREVSAAARRPDVRAAPGRFSARSRPSTPRAGEGRRRRLRREVGGGRSRRAPARREEHARAAFSSNGSAASREWEVEKALAADRKRRRAGPSCARRSAAQKARKARQGMARC